VTRDKIKIAIQLTCDILDPKLTVIEKEILKGHSRIEVGMILQYKTNSLRRGGEPKTSFFDIRTLLNFVALSQFELNHQAQLVS